jgi:predicted RNA methylase
MTALPQPLTKNAHIWARHPDDWYVEPEWCSRRLFDVERFDGAIVDPSCGLGRIVASARSAGLEAHGSDIKRRSEICGSLGDFMATREAVDNVVSNPPFGIADKYAAHAISVARYKVALLLPTKWMNAA